MHADTVPQAVQAIVHAYYDLRDIEAVLACVTEDITWVGTEADDTAHGKAALRRLLEADVDAFPDAFTMEMDAPMLKPVSDTVTEVCVTGRQVEEPGAVCGIRIRGTAMCVKTADGWLVDSLHVSVPNLAMEKYTLTRELDADRKKEQTLMAGIPGGVAIYRLTKDGRVRTDYVSGGLAKMCGYDDAEEFRAYLGENAMVNVVAEDASLVLAAVEASMKTHQPLSVRYRIHTRGKGDILNRLDANMIDNGEETVWYAVHTVVSEEDKHMIEEQKRLQELVAKVPGGMGIYEIENGRLHLAYLNDAYYRILGVTRAERQKYTGSHALEAIHPEDTAVIRAMIMRFEAGCQDDSALIRVCGHEGRWIWLNLAISVVERRPNHLKLYIAYTDCNDLVLAQRELQNSRVMLSAALGNAHVRTWNFDFRNHTLRDAGHGELAYPVPAEPGALYRSLFKAGTICPESEADLLWLFDHAGDGETLTRDIRARAEDRDAFVWNRVTCTPVFDARGVCVEVIGTAVDITEQKDREQAYEEKLRLRKLNTQGTMSVGTFNLTKNTVIESESRDPVIRQATSVGTIDDVLGFIAREIPADSTFPRSCREILARYAKGESHFSVRYCMTHGFRWIESTFDVVTNPYNGDIEASGVMLDVSDAVRAELVVSKLLETDYDSIATINVETGVAQPFTISASELGMGEMLAIQDAGHDVAASLETFYRTYCVPEDVERTIRENSMEAVKAALAQSPVYECNYRVDFGKCIEHKRVIYAYLDANRTYLICAVQNLTEAYLKEERQRAELSRALKQAEAANQAKTAFLSRVSHDMRTPLNGILGLTAILKASITDDQLSRDLVDLELSGQYLLNLINDTLDMSRIESGRLELHPVVCDGRVLFNSTLSLARLSMQPKHIRFTVHADDLPFTKLYVDVGRVEQVVMNVLGNAAKFTPEGGSVDVTMTNVSVCDDVITDKLVVQDTGIGMSPAFLPHIFDAFAQEDASRTSSYQGTGLGMSITKQVLERMGGEISVTSELGKGSCFTIILKLPVATDAQIAAWSRTQTSLGSGIDLAGRHILLCEDHPLNARIAAKLLEAKGIVVAHAENGQIGVNMFAASQPGYYDAVLMDIRMPVMDGLDAARTIRALPRQDARLVPIIAMTANAFSDDIRQTRQAGMDAHLSKPIQTDALYETLASFLNVERDFRREKVLVVDDLEVNRAVIRASLEQDYEILEAENGRQAMDIVRNTRGLDAVITDIQMPGMDGVELIRQIRSDSRWRHIVIIANTQFGDPEQEEKLLALGADDFVYKPTTTKIVEIRVRNALRKL